MTIILLNEQRGRVFHELSYEISSRNYVTQHPVENYVDVTDNIEVQPDEVSCRVIESDQRFGPAAAAPGAQSFTQQAELFLEEARGQLLALLFAGRPTLTSYALVGYSRRRSNAGHLEYSLTFRQIRIARSTTVRVPPSLTNRPGGADQQSLGQSATRQGRDGIAISTLRYIGAVSAP